jgi:sorbitol-specific phosphotransferase system component IIA
MAIIHDLIEISGLNFNSTLTFANGGLLDVIDNVQKIRNPGDPDEEFNNGDTLIIGGVAYQINEIYVPSNNSTRIIHDGGTVNVADRNDNDVDVLILEVRSGATTRYFLIPADRLGNLSNISSITLGAFEDAGGNDATITAFANNSITICFTRGVLIRTIEGEVPIEKLVANNLVLTMDNGYQPIRWIGSRSLSRDELRANPALLPIRIRADALGRGMPRRDLLVSRQHRILLRSRIARNMFGCPEVLVPAKDLVFMQGVEEVGESDFDQIDYWHFMFDRHQVVYAEGAAAESLFTGPEALRAVGPEAAQEIFKILPELAHVDMRVRGQMARPELTGRHARKLALRHMQKSRALFEAL